jgi:hypothetical protein
MFSFRDTRHRQMGQDNKGLQCNEKRNVVRVATEFIHCLIRLYDSVSVTLIIGVRNERGAFPGKRQFVVWYSYYTPKHAGINSCNIIVKIFDTRGRNCVLVSPQEEIERSEVRRPRRLCNRPSTSICLPGYVAPTTRGHFPHIVRGAVEP